MMEQRISDGILAEWLVSDPPVFSTRDIACLCCDLRDARKAMRHALSALYAHATPGSIAGNALAILEKDYGFFFKVEPQAKERKPE